MNRLIPALALLTPVVAFAEGSDQTDVNTGTKAAPQILDVIPDSGGGRLTRLYADVLNVGEIIAFNEGDGTLEIRDPDNNIVATLNPGSGTCGQPTCRFTTTEVGVYELRFSVDQPSWDVSVSGTASGKGRLWSTEWHFDAITFGDGTKLASNCQTAGYASGCDGRTFASFYTVVGGGDDSRDAVVEMKTEGMAGYIYTIAANDYGAPGANGRSVFEASGFNVPPQHRVYLLPPEDASYNPATPVLDAASVDYDSALCDQVAEGVATGDFVLSSNVVGTYHVVCDLDDNNIYDFTSDDDLHLIGQIDITTEHRVSWEGVDNGGTPVPAGVYDCDAWITVGEFHYVGRDIESVFPGLRLFEVNSNQTRSGLPMFWNDDVVQHRAVNMATGLKGLETSGPGGIDSGTWPNSTCVVDPATFLSSPCAQPNTNARSWGNFNLNPDNGSTDNPDDDNSKGNVAWLDTYTWIAESNHLPIQITVGSLADTDMEGLLDAEEDCLYDTNPNEPDSDFDGLEDDEEVLVTYGIFTDPNDEDSDGDGLQDGFETPDPDDPQDSDDDNIIDALDPDDDNDDVPTADEDYGDGGFGTPGDGDPSNDNTDGDSFPDYLDVDDDNDTVDTKDEDPNDNGDPQDDDTDGDGTPNYLDDNDDGDLLDTVDEDVNGNGDPTDDDADNDGIPNYLEEDDDGDGILTNDEDYGDGGFGTPGDGDPTNDDWDEDELPDYLDPDDDNDGIPSSVEGSGDTDGDGTPDHHDDDSDGDGLLDSEEGTNDTDGDGTPDFQDPDDDGDGIPTSYETGQGDSDGDNIPDYLDEDDDNDTVLTKDEDYSDGDGGPADGDASNDDTDGDGTPNYQDTDDDNDTIPTATEAEDSRELEDFDVDEDGNENWVDTDADGDSVNNGVTTDEYEGTTDTDQDGVPDYLDPDGEYSRHYQGSCGASTTGGPAGGFAWLGLAALIAFGRRKRGGLARAALLFVAAGLALQTPALAGDAPEISRSAGKKSEVIVLWPRVIIGEDAGEVQAVAASLQQRLEVIATKADRGSINPRPEPQRVCPQAGCKGVNIGSVLVAQHGGCAAVATVSGPGQSRAKLIPFAGTLEIETLSVEFREPPESHFIVHDMQLCGDLMNNELEDAEAAIMAAVAEAAP